MRNLTLVVIGVVIGILGVLLITKNIQVPEDIILNTQIEVVENFEDCVTAGNPVMESYPRQCRHGDTTYIEELDIKNRPFPGESDVKSFEECEAAGHPITTTEPRRCTDSDGETFEEDYVEPVAFTCSNESRYAEACIQIFEPVCGFVRVDCFTTPCPPLPETFINSCEACKNQRVVSYTEGMCEE